MGIPSRACACGSGLIVGMAYLFAGRAVLAERTVLMKDLAIAGVLVAGDAHQITGLTPVPEPTTASASLSRRWSRMRAAPDWFLA